MSNCFPITDLTSPQLTIQATPNTWIETCHSFCSNPLMPFILLIEYYSFCLFLQCPPPGSSPDLSLQLELLGHFLHESLHWRHQSFPTSTCVERHVSSEEGTIWQQPMPWLTQQPWLAGQVSFPNPRCVCQRCSLRNLLTPRVILHHVLPCIKVVCALITPPPLLPL